MGIDPKLQNKIAKFYQNKVTIEALQKENKELQKEFAGDLAVDKYLVGDHLEVVVSPNRRFDANKAKEHLSESQFRKVSKRVADKKLVEAHYPDVVESCYTEYANKVTVRLHND